MFAVAIALLAASATPVPPAPLAPDSCICDPAEQPGCSWPGLSIVSRNSAGLQAPNHNAFDASISADGRWIAFRSRSRFFAGTSNHPREQIYLKDTETGTLTLASPSLRGGPSNSINYDPVLSHDGRYVAYVSKSSDLVAATDGLRSIPRNVFVFDRLSGEVMLVSEGFDGEPANHDADNAVSFSPNGDRLVFASKADNLHPDDTEGSTDIYVWDFASRELSLVEPTTISNYAGDSRLSSAREPSFSGVDNRITYIQQFRTALPGGGHVIVHDLDTNIAEIVSTNAAGEFMDGSAENPVFSHDGRSVLFLVDTDNLIEEETGGEDEAYIKDLDTGEVILASRDWNGDPIEDHVYNATLSASGRFVAFVTTVPRAPNGPSASGQQVFLFDRVTGRSNLASAAHDGGRVGAWTRLLPEAFSVEGQLVFDGRDRNYVVDDLNGGRADIYLTGCTAP